MDETARFILLVAGMFLVAGGLYGLLPLLFLRRNQGRERKSHAGADLLDQVRQPSEGIVVPFKRRESPDLADEAPAEPLEAITRLALGSAEHGPPTPAPTLRQPPLPPPEPPEAPGEAPAGGPRPRAPDEGLAEGLAEELFAELFTIRAAIAELREEMRGLRNELGPATGRGEPRSAA